MRRSSVLLAVAALATTTPAFAASLTAPLGQAVRIPIRGAATDVIVGDTKIADVTVVGPNALFVSGRGYGSTNVIVMGAGGRTLFDGRVLVPMSNANQVTVHRGRERASVLCTPNCDMPASDGKGDDSLTTFFRAAVAAAPQTAAPAPTPAPAPAATPPAVAAVRD